MPGAAGEPAAFFTLKLGMTVNVYHVLWTKGGLKS